MKNYMILAVVAGMATAAVGGGYFYYLQNSSASITIMYDVTDSIQTAQDTIDVPAHISSVTSKWGETHLRFLPISDFKENKATELDISAQFPLTANPYARQKALKASNQSILAEIADLAKENTGRTASIIYYPVATELNRLAVSGEHTKQLIVFSDLQVNAPTGFSVYRSSDSILLQQHPEKVQALFEKEMPLSDLKGISVYLIYDAPTPNDQNRFLIMAGLWKQMFEAHGAHVVISPNLSSY